MGIVPGTLVIVNGLASGFALAHGLEPRTAPIKWIRSGTVALVLSVADLETYKTVTLMSSNMELFRLDVDQMTVLWRPSNAASH
jgi:hypothetical protein